MPEFSFRRLAWLLSPILVAAFLAFMYLRTLAPGLTWANDGADGGDLIAAAATGGVPHPTGYPIYLAVAAAFLRLPVGSLALRTNVLSLVSAVLAATLIYAIVLAVTQSTLASSVAAIAFGTTPLMWSQAIITEVYALQALLTVLFLTCLLALRPRRFIELTLGLSAGLGMGNHMMGALLLPLLLLPPRYSGPPLGAGPNREGAQSVSLKKVYLERLLGLVAGLAIYLVIPLRASARSPVNWGNVASPQDLLFLVSGQMYWSRLQHTEASYLLAGIRSWSQFMEEQLTIVGLLLALFGLIALFRPGILYVSTIWLAVSSSTLSILYFSPDSYVFTIPLLVSCSIWIGLATHWLSNRASRRIPWAGRGVASLVMGLFMLRALLAVPDMDLSGDRRAEVFGRSILASVPPNSILLAQGDESTFALWYFHFALNERSDIAVISRDLLVQDWYHEVLRYTYADLVVPGKSWTDAANRANPGRPVCEVTSIVPPGLECSRPAGAT